MALPLFAAGAIGGMVGSLVTLAAVATVIQSIIKKFQEWGLMKTAQYLMGMYKYVEMARGLPKGQLLGIEDAKMYRQYLAQANAAQYKECLDVNGEKTLMIEARKIEVEMEVYLPPAGICVVM